MVDTGEALHFESMVLCGEKKCGCYCQFPCSNIKESTVLVNI